jgi:hypothetical protein
MILQKRKGEVEMIEAQVVMRECPLISNITPWIRDLMKKEDLYMKVVILKLPLKNIVKRLYQVTEEIQMMI